MDGCADDIMRAVLDAIDEIGASLFGKNRAIGERAHILAKLLRIEAVLLELEPVRLMRPGNQYFDESFDIQSPNATNSYKIFVWLM
jgi:hypothetical protein